MALGDNSWSYEDENRRGEDFVQGGKGKVGQLHYKWGKIKVNIWGSFQEVAWVF